MAFPNSAPPYKPIKIATTPYNPPPPGQLQTWQRETAQASPGKLTKITARRVQVTKMIAKGAAAVAIGVIGLFAIRAVIRKILSISSFDVKAPGQPAKGATGGRREHDPYTDHDFQLLIDGVKCGSFQKFDGLNWDCDVIEYRDSMDPYPRKRPGIYRFGNLKLTKGMLDNSALYDWIVQIQNGDIARKNGAINVLDNFKDKTKPVLTYEFFQAFPIKWSGIRTDGKGNAALIEELELAVDSFNLKKG